MSLTEDQLDRALAHIDYPRAKHAADPLRRLHQLMLHHLARVPFENVGIHYSKTHILSLALDDLFDKIVVRSKGGYCVELNAFFAAILRGLGYKVLTVAGRVKHGDTYSGWFVFFPSLFSFYLPHSFSSKGRSCIFLAENG